MREGRTIERRIIIEKRIEIRERTEIRTEREKRRTRKNKKKEGKKNDIYIIASHISKYLLDRSEPSSTSLTLIYIISYGDF